MAAGSSCLFLVMTVRLVWLSCCCLVVFYVGRKGNLLDCEKASVSFLGCFLFSSRLVGTVFCCCMWSLPWQVWERTFGETRTSVLVLWVWGRTPSGFFFFIARINLSKPDVIYMSSLGLEFERKRALFTENHNHQRKIKWFVRSCQIYPNSAGSRPDRVFSMVEEVRQITPSHCTYFQEFLSYHIPPSKPNVHRPTVTTTAKRSTTAKKRGYQIYIIRQRNKQLQQQRQQKP